MTITRRIEQFIKETAELALCEDADLTIEETINEYKNQIQEDDFYNVVNWANWKGVKIPVKLRNVIDPDYDKDQDFDFDNYNWD